jgi:hypothetical protein
MLVLQTSVLNKLPMECFSLQINEINGTNYRTTLWCHRASGMKNSTIMNAQKHSSRRGLRRGRGVLYICRQKSQFADYRYKFLDERCRKCPSDNVNNFVEIEKFFIFGKNYHMSEQNFLIFEKNYDICGKILLSSKKIMTYPKIFLSRPTTPPPPPPRRQKFQRKFFRCPFLSKSAPWNRPPHFFMLPAPLSVTPQHLSPLCDSPVRPAWRYISVGPVSGII